MFAAALVLLAAAPAASAVTRYAAPGGLTTGNCTSADPADPVNGPCYFPHAVQQAQTGDNVDVFEGTHDLGSATVDTFGKTDLTIRGAPGQAVPLIVSTGSNAVLTVRENVAARRLALVNTGTGYGVGAFGGTIEQVYAQSTTGQSAGCYLQFSDAVLRDSVCWTSSPSALSAGLVVERLFSGTLTETIRNVTAVAPAAGAFGIRARAPNAGALVTVNAVNVIARGGGADVRAEAGEPTSSVTVNLAHSNYETSPVGGGPGAELINGAATNQTGAPLFANAAAGDFHQLAGSPTIDAGIVDASVGTADLDGDLRQIGPAPDIGADEFIPPPPQPEPEPEPQAGDTAPPDTTITAGPDGRTKKKSATFSFSGSDSRAVASFQCKLDGGSFETCTSPKTFSGLKKGRHTVEVRAVDAAGNVDPTPATRTWKVKKKRKRH